MTTLASEKTLHVPDTVISGPTVGLVDRHRGIGVCFESGWVGDLRLDRIVGAEVLSAP